MSGDSAIDQDEEDAFDSDNYSSATAISDIVVNPVDNPTPDFGPMIKYFDNLVKELAAEAEAKTKTQGPPQGLAAPEKRPSVARKFSREVLRTRARSRSISSWSGRHHFMTASASEIKAATRIQAMVRGYNVRKIQRRVSIARTRKQKRYTFDVPTQLFLPDLSNASALIDQGAQALHSALGKDSPTRAMVEEINRVRGEPASIADHLENRLQYLKNGVIFEPGRGPMGLMTLEARPGQEEAIEFLRTTPKQDALRVSPILTALALLHASDVGSKSLFGPDSSTGAYSIRVRAIDILTRAGLPVRVPALESHVPILPTQAGKASIHVEVGDKLAPLALMLTTVYKSDPSNTADMVLQMAVDDGIKSRYRRNAMFSPRYSHVGVASAKHEIYGLVTVFVYASEPVAGLDAQVDLPDPLPSPEVLAQLPLVVPDNVSPALASAMPDQCLRYLRIILTEMALLHAYSDPSLACPGCKGPVGVPSGKVFIGPRAWHSECSAVCRTCLSSQSEFLAHSALPTCRSCLTSHPDYRCSRCARPVIADHFVYPSSKEVLCVSCFNVLVARPGVSSMVKPSSSASSSSSSLSESRSIHNLSPSDVAAAPDAFRSLSLTAIPASIRGSSLSPHLFDFRPEDWVGRTVISAPVISPII